MSPGLREAAEPRVSGGEAFDLARRTSGRKRNAADVPDSRFPATARPGRRPGGGAGPGGRLADFEVSVGCGGELPAPRLPFAILSYDDGRQAVISTSVRTRLGNGAQLSGSTGCLRVEEPLYCPEAITYLAAPPRAGGGGPRRLERLLPAPVVRTLKGLRARLRSDRRVWPVLGNGYAHEAAEAMRCVRAGEKECPVMPLDESVAVMEVVDEIRSTWPRRVAEARTEGATE